MTVLLRKRETIISFTTRRRFKTGDLRVCLILIFGQIIDKKMLTKD